MNKYKKQDKKIRKNKYKLMKPLNKAIDITKYLKNKIIY